MLHTLRDRERREGDRVFARVCVCVRLKEQMVKQAEFCRCCFISFSTVQATHHFDCLSTIIDNVCASCVC